MLPRVGTQNFVPPKRMPSYAPADRVCTDLTRSAAEYSYNPGLCCLGKIISDVCDICEVCDICDL